MDLIQCHCHDYVTWQSNFNNINKVINKLILRQGDSQVGPVHEPFKNRKFSPADGKRGSQRDLKFKRLDLT